MFSRNRQLVKYQRIIDYNVNPIKKLQLNVGGFLANI